MYDLMVDLETLNTTPDSVILSIGCQHFDIVSGTMGETFYCNVDAQSCLDIGLTMNTNTIYWWLGQEAAAGKAVQNDRVNVKDACVFFDVFIRDNCDNLRKAKLWGNGSGFDNVILRHIFRVLGMPFPLGFGRDRDMRTIVDLAPFIPAERRVQREGTYHNALDDAIFQAKTVSQCYDVLKKKGADIG